MSLYNHRKSEMPISVRLPLLPTLGVVAGLSLLSAVPERRYAIAAYHDLDDDAKLGRNLLGIPTEPFGFGNDAEVRFRAPGFEATSITVSGGLTRTFVALR